MTADHSNRPSMPQAIGETYGRDDESARQAMAELSRRLGERAARQRTVDPGAAAAARRAAMQAYDRARARRVRLAVCFAVGAIIGSGIAMLVPTMDPRPDLSSLSAEAAPEAAPVSIASAAPAPVAPESPSPAAAATASVPDAPVVEPAAADQPAPVEATPSEPALRRDDVREVQARLRSFGFNPGPVDGAAGRMTEGAVARYQQERGQPQTGKVDRNLLEQLRQDPAPQAARQVAQRAPRTDSRATRPAPPRRSDPFEPVRAAGDRFGRWLDSLVR